MGRIDEPFDHDDGPQQAQGAKRAEGAVAPPRAPVILSRNIVYTTTRTVEVPMQTLRANRIIAGFGPGALTDTYKILSTQVLQRMRARQWTSLGVSSPGSGEGKTLTAINLAVSLAAEFNLTALLVDADLRRPSVAQYFGIGPSPGLSDYLMWNAPLEDLLINPGIPGFVFLPGGKPLASSSEALGWQRMADLVQELESRYPNRMVLFDLPPMLRSADVLAFAPHVDAALLVIEEGYTQRDALRRAVEMLNGTPIVGTVLNKSAQARISGGTSPGWMSGLLRRGR
jgi:Mrp family chromosome partitioning ATPase